jgi:hypothetical protein
MTHKIAQCLFFLNLFLNPSLNAQDRQTFSTQPVEAKLYSPTDIVFKVKNKSVENPIDAEFGAIFTAKDSQTLKIQGFYNDNDEYILRFSPTKKGIWTFQTYSSVSQLSGLSGTVSVTDNTNAEVHGAVEIKPNSNRKFTYQDGTPYFALAFESDWLFALDYANKTALPKTEKMVSEIKKNGFNQVVMNVYAYDVGWKLATDVPAEYEFKKPNYSVFKGGNEAPQYSALNIDFFKHFDRVINHLHQKGIVAHVMIYVWNKKVNWAKMYSADDNRYFDYVIKRYQGYANIVWDVSKEALDYGRCDIPYINERIHRIRQNDAYKRLVTVHDYEYCSREPDKVDFISIQNWRSDLSSLSLAAYNKHADKPVMNIEHGGYEEGPFLSFEGNYVNAEACLVRNYECIFSGVYSTYYWQNAAWNIVIYDPFDPKHIFQKPRFDYYKHLQNLFIKYDFNSLYPSTPKFTTNGRVGEDNMTSSGYPLSNGKDLYLYFVPAANHQINVVLPEPPSKKMEATWFNPFTGEYKEEGTSDWWLWKAYKSPWKNTASVLILKMK